MLSAASSRDGAARAAAARDKLLADLSPLYEACLHLMETTRDALPGVVLVGDSAQPVYAASIYFPSAAPRSWFTSATGYGTLGYALPAAIGAQLAAPDRPVVCVVGDGGSSSHPGAGLSARDRDAGDRAAVEQQRLWRDQELHGLETNPPIGVDIFTPDFQLLAKGFGCEAVRLKNPADLPKLLREATTRKTATIIEIDEADYVANYRG